MSQVRYLRANLTEAFTQIVNETAREFSLQPEELLLRFRIPTIVRARHRAMERCRAETDASLTEIGKFFKRDHTSVLQALRHKRQAVLGE